MKISEKRATGSQRMLNLGIVSWPIRLVFIALVGILFYMLGLKMLENRFIFFPAKYPSGYWEPESLGLKVEDCYFFTEDRVKLHGWYIPNKNANATVLYCHGNGGNITYGLEHLKTLVDLGLNIFAFDYRGYGRSEGQPSEQGVYMDAEAAYNHLIKIKRVSPWHLIVHGQSLGGAVAIDLASRKKCAGLIVESSFTSAQDMAREMFHWLPVHLFMKTKFDSVSKIRKVRAPVLILHGTKDRTVPFKFGKQLYEAAEEEKFFYEVEGADHNDTHLIGGRKYLEKIEEFIFSIAIPLSLLGRRE